MPLSLADSRGATLRLQAVKSAHSVSPRNQPDKRSFAAVAALPQARRFVRSKPYPLLPWSHRPPIKLHRLLKLYWSQRQLFEDFMRIMPHKALHLLRIICLIAAFDRSLFFLLPHDARKFPQLCRDACDFVFEVFLAALQFHFQTSDFLL